MSDVLSESDIRELQGALNTPEGRSTIAQTMLEPALTSEGLFKSYCLLENGVNTSFTYMGENKDVVPAISRKLENCTQNGIPGKTFVTCAICGKKATQLSSHIIRMHGTSVKEYHTKFPGWKTIADDLTAQKAAKLSPRAKAFWASEVGREAMKDANEKRVRTNLTRYGVAFPNQEKAQQANRELWQNPEWKEEMRTKMVNGVVNKFGVDNIRKDPEFKERSKGKRVETCQARYSVSNASQIPGVQEKIRKSAQCQANKAEKFLQTLLPDFVKYSGDGSFWIKLQDGSPKNPDFVVRPFKKWNSVIELFGEFWHKPEEEKWLCEEYAKVGVRCLVVWNKELQSKARRQLLADKIVAFLTLTGSSETTRKTPEMGEDIVHSNKSLTASK